MSNIKEWKITISNTEHKWLKEESFFITNDDFQEMTRSRTFSELIDGSGADNLSFSIAEHELSFREQE